MEQDKKTTAVQIGGDYAGDPCSFWSSSYHYLSFVSGRGVILLGLAFLRLFGYLPWNPESFKIES